MTEGSLTGDRLADQAEFVEWVRPVLPAMTRLAARLTSGTSSDDVVQEALSKAWQKRSQFDPDRGTPAAWLLAITANEARKSARRRWFPIRFEVGVRSDVAEDHLDIETAVRRLPKRQRLAVDCYYFAGLSVNETAAVMRCSEGTVKSTLSDARRHLRSFLEVLP